MFAIPYDPTRASLYLPGRADNFFMYGPISSEAALCAEMSRVAYVREKERLEIYLKRADFTLVEAIGYDRRGTQFFIAKSDYAARPVMIVAFRGTELEDPTDVFVDLRLAKGFWEGAGKVHEGFRDALPDLAALGGEVPSDARVLYTGHSLGAALATLAAALHRPTYLYTFGSPRVGDAEFVASIFGIDHERYVDCCDLVAKVPPDDLGYLHVDFLRYIDRHGRVLPSPSEQAMTHDQLQASAEYLYKYAPFSGNVLARQGADHAPINYVSAVMGLRP